MRHACAQIAKGDERAFVALYDSWHQRALQLAGAWAGRNQQLAEDAVQELFMRVIKSLPPLRTRAALDAWLTITLRRIVLDALRTQERQRQRLVAAGDAARKQAARAQASQDEDMDANVLQLIAALEADEQELLRLRVVQGLTLEQVGLSSQLSIGSVHGRVRRALAMLRATLKGQQMLQSPRRHGSEGRKP